jgi:hypothetical protein
MGRKLNRNREINVFGSDSLQNGPLGQLSDESGMSHCRDLDASVRRWCHGKTVQTLKRSGMDMLEQIVKLERRSG